MQVKHMGSIFGRAERILVWLGSAEQVYAIVKELSVVNDHRLADEEPLRDSWEGFELRRSVAEEKKHQVSAVIKDCPWFVRTWVRQEVRAGGFEGQKIVIVSGGTEFSWINLVQCAIYLTRPFVKYSTDEISLLFADIDDPLTAIAHHHLHVLLLTSLEKMGRSSRIDLGLLVRSCRVFKASDPKDKVYGIIGMYVDRPESDPRSEEMKQSMSFDSFLVDYRKHVAEVYTDMCRYVIKRNEHLGLLELHAFNPYENHLQLPSWVFNWDRSSVTVLQSIHAALIRGYGESMEPQPEESNIFEKVPKEDEKLPPKFSLNDAVEQGQPDCVLSVQGFVLGKIAERPIAAGAEWLRHNIKKCCDTLGPSRSPKPQQYVQTGRTGLTPLLGDAIGQFWKQASVATAEDPGVPFVDLSKHFEQSTAIVRLSWAFENPDQIWQHGYFLPWCRAGDIIV